MSEIQSSKLKYLRLIGLSNSYGKGNYDGYYASDNDDESPNRNLNSGKGDDIYIKGIMDGDRKVKIKIF